MRDIVNNLFSKAGFDQFRLRGDSVGNVIDLRGYGGVMAIVSLLGGDGVTTENPINLILEHSDDGTNFSPVGKVDFIAGSQDMKSVMKEVNPTSGIFMTIKNKIDNLSTYEVGYCGSKRYLRLRAALPQDLEIEVGSLFLMLYPAQSKNALI